MPPLVRYRVLTLDSVLQALPPGPVTAALDANVVVDMERGAKGKIPETSSVYRELTVLTRALRGRPTIAAYAVAELCADRTMGWDADRQAEVIAGIEHWLGPVRRRTPSTEQMYERSVQGTRLLYASLLKAATLWLRAQQRPGFRPRERIDLYREYVQFVEFDLGGVSVYTLKVTLDLLLGHPTETRYARGLLKFGTNLEADLWGAAWDLMHLNLMESTVDSARGFGRRRGCLVTADKSLAGVRDKTCVTTSSGGLRGYMWATHFFHPELRSAEKEIMAINDELIRRATPWRSDRYSRLPTVIRSLEEEARTLRSA
jgi:hypothetical protein